MPSRGGSVPLPTGGSKREELDLMARLVAELGDLKRTLVASGKYYLLKLTDSEQI
jgi:hypothetical protein